MIAGMFQLRDFALSSSPNSSTGTVTGRGGDRWLIREPGVVHRIDDRTVAMHAGQPALFRVDDRIVNVCGLHPAASDCSRPRVAIITWPVGSMTGTP